VASYYRIQELGNALLIKAHRDAERWERLLVAGFAATFVGVFGASIFGGWWWMILSCGAGVAAFAIRWGMNAQLQATNVEFVTKGDLGRRARIPRILCTGDVCRLEFQNPTLKPSGLYAVTARKRYCILPFLDYPQTIEVIRAIENKFPGLAERWRENAAANHGPSSESLRGLF
jgi:hypothetical protein